MLGLFRKLVTVLTVAAGLMTCTPAFAAVVAAPTNDAASTSVPARWQHHLASFHYSGFTTHYSCDGMRYKLRLLLKTMGARGIKVSDVCTEPYGQPQLFHDIKVGFEIPVPAKIGDLKGTFPARWREVTIAALNPLDVDWGDCELVEQLRDQLLPLFHARSVVNRTACIPHQDSAGQPYLRMSLLMPINHSEGGEGGQVLQSSNAGSLTLLKPR